MSAVAGCKPPCCFTMWCFEWAFTWDFLLFKIWTVVKFLLKNREISLEEGGVLHTETQLAVCNPCLSRWAHFLLFLFYAKPECWITSHSCSFLGPLNCRKGLKSCSKLERRRVLPANLHSISLLPMLSPHSLTPRSDKNKVYLNSCNYICLGEQPRCQSIKVKFRKVKSK